MMQMFKTLKWKIVLPLLLVLGLGLAWLSRDSSAPMSATPHGELEIQSWRTSNGARVMFVAAPQLPMVDVRVVFDAGSARDGDMPGLAQLTASMLNQGAGEWDTETLAQRFDNIGASYGVSVSRDSASFSLRSLTEAALLEQAVATFATILREPRFPGEDLQRLRRNMLLSLQNKRQSPASIADDQFYLGLFGQHPYALPVEGTEDSLRDLARDDLREFHARYLVASNAVVAIVGQLNRRQAEALVNQVLGGLPAGEAAPALPEVAELREAQRIDRRHPSSQTHILVGQPGLRRNDQDYFALYLGNHILGGSGFGSRIMETIRERRGLAYSSYSYFVPQRVKGPFIMGLQTSNHQAEEALGLLQEVLEKFIDQGPTEQEMQHAIRNITGGFPLRINSNRNIVEHIAVIGFYDLPLDYLRTFNSKIEAVSAAEVRDAFQRRIDPQRLITVTVGNHGAPAE